MGLNRHDNPAAHAVDVDAEEEVAEIASDSDADPDAVPAGYIPPADKITPPEK